MTVPDSEWRRGLAEGTSRQFVAFNGLRAILNDLVEVHLSTESKTEAYGGFRGKEKDRLLNSDGAGYKTGACAISKAPALIL
jgi:hypothetical protein